MIVNTEFSLELKGSIEEFKQKIISEPYQILDPPEVHHELAGKAHGRKLDFDRIETGSLLFRQWMSLKTRWYKEVYYGEPMPDALVGVANGGNRLATTLAALVGSSLGLETYKKTDGTVGLTDISRTALQLNSWAVSFIVIEEDVGTTGSTTASLVPELWELGIERIEVAHTWIRSLGLVALDRLEIPYGGLIVDPIPSFSADACKNLSEGLCHQGIDLIQRES